MSRTMGFLRKADSSVVELDPNCYWVVIASDDVFDALDNETIAKLVMEELDIHRAAALITHIALSHNSADNISIVVVDI
jgi:serine/threonine protein phosphatase PrpC